MRKYLIISELAALMNISTSSIRYYEQQGLISPYKIDDNGYRLYDYDQIDRLEMILLLRKLDVPLKQLKNIIDNYSIESYIETLNNSLKSIDSRIDQLKSKRKYVVHKLNDVERLKNIKTSYDVVYMPERVLYCFHTGKIYDYSIKETYDISYKNIDYLSIYQDGYMIPLEHDIFSFCMLKTPETGAVEHFNTITLPEGYYLNYGFFIQSYDEIDIETLKFYDYMEKNKLSPNGKPIIIENTTTNLYLDTIYLNLQIHI